MECLERVLDRSRSSSLRWRPALTAGNFIEPGWKVNSIVARSVIPQPLGGVPALRAAAYAEAGSLPADCCTLSMMRRPIFGSNPKGSVMR